ncbi:MAG: hypothetical protein DMENIID0002_13900 [Rickettsia endosymbiont of Sergentomyia squamirostris]|uniref:Uncharacterized protein n=1 Tax=Candidatus Tisiphia endosymbiont of Sergentomyia squamirostris TaxID=3113639 RepID=A0AAT9GAA7_9RICK
MLSYIKNPYLLLGYKINTTIRFNVKTEINTIKKMPIIVALYVAIIIRQYYLGYDQNFQS